jgi:hypothetical protein
MTQFNPVSLDFVLFATAALESNSGAEPPDVRWVRVGRVA